MFTRIVIFIVTVSRFTSVDAAISDRIIFPGETLENRNGNDDQPTSYSNGPVVVPESCRNLTYCFEKPINYPQERYDKMFEGKNLAPLPSIVESDIVNRLADDEYEDDCDAEVRYDPLYSIRTKKGDWRHIIQAPTQNFHQRVRIEICTSTSSTSNKSCFKGYPIFGGITTFCRQKTAKYEFVVDDGKGGSSQLESELPSCCVCHYKAPI